VVSLLTERRRHPPWGLSGGQPGSPGRNVLRRGSGEIPVDPKATFVARWGDIVVVETPGGGGYGPP
jgi:N-methylhydantoinase B/oxoprolinase/acetone carboxylase alpha subunit